MITISVVSHGQGAMLDRLLVDLARIATTSAIEIIVTENIADSHILANLPTTCPTQVIRNAVPMGFGANHNQAFARASGDLFCIVNPDIRIGEDPFPEMCRALHRHNAGAVAPAIVSPGGSIDDSARRFPTPWSLALRRLGGPDGRYEFALGQPPLAVDWVAGMFVLFDAAVFRAIGGFDDGFFLYCEDIDISARIWRYGRQIVVCPQVSAIHDAQRASHRNVRYLKWHLASYARYFAKHLFRAPQSCVSQTT